MCFTEDQYNFFIVYTLLIYARIIKYVQIICIDVIIYVVIIIIYK